MEYSSQVMDHFQNPRNFGTMDKPDAEAMVGNPICGDVMKIYLRIEENEQGQEVITDIKFETFGCAAAIATSSAITEMALNKTLNEVLTLTNKDVADRLGGLPANKMHCSVLAADALQQAIADFRQQQKKQQAKTQD